MPDNPNEIKSESRRWFRFYAESINDPKVQRLPAHLFKTWVNLLCLASANGGTLPSREDIAFQLRMSDHDANAHIDELIGVGLVDITHGKTLEPHNWNARQYVSDTSKQRTRQYRDRLKRACDVTVTPPDTDTESDTESVKTRGARADDMPSHVKPIANWSQAFAPADESPGVIRTETGCIQLVNGTLQRWLERFGSPARLDLALIEIAGEINEGSRKPLAADVEMRLARRVSEKLDRDERYQAAAAKNAATAVKAAPAMESTSAMIARMRAEGAFS